MEQRANLTAAERELGRVKKEIQKIIDAIVDGVRGAEVKDRMAELQDRKEALIKQLEAASQPPPLLHPRMAEVYRSKVRQLAEGLQHEESRPEAAEALRALVDAIVLTPEAGELKIELKGNLAAMLGSAQNAKRSPETGDLLLQVSLVAGARNLGQRTLVLRAKIPPRAIVRRRAA
jgi:site-specific DNA recombinase